MGFNILFKNGWLTYNNKFSEIFLLINDITELSNKYFIYIKPIYSH